MTVGIVLGLGWSGVPSSLAQLPVPPVITNPVDRTIGQVEQVGRDVERGLDGRLVESRRRLESLPAQLPEALARPSQLLSDLPERLPIQTGQGNPAWVEVSVEDGWRAVEYQWLGMLTDAELPLLDQVGAEILEQTPLDDLGLNLVRFRVAPAFDSRPALTQQLPQALVERLDRNHIYNPQVGNSQKRSDRLYPPAPAAIVTRETCDDALAIGMVDTAIATEHPGLLQAKITQRHFLTEAGEAANLQQPLAHGTAVAGLLVGRGEISSEALNSRQTEVAAAARLPNATLYNASVFYSRNQFAQGATLMHLVKGLNWLLEQEVSVLNMSLAGPDNRILRAAIDNTLARGKAIVAAAGNEGPAAPPLFPAAYPGVIAATAVDSEQQIYRWANRGEHIDFAATGVSVLTARSNGDFGRETGTSMAAPVITALVACELAKPDASVQAVIEALADRAEDLGDRGRDPVFGYGLLR